MRTPASPSIHFIGLFLLLAAGAGAQTYTRSCPVDHTPPSAADQALAHGDFEQAEHLYNTALTSNPVSSAAKVGVVRAEMGQGKLHEALTYARKNVLEHPQDPMLLVALAEAEFRMGEPTEAAKALSGAGAVDPCIARLHYDLGRYLSIAGMAGSARKQLELAHRLAPEDPLIDRFWKEATAPPVSVEARIVQLEQHLSSTGIDPEEKRALDETINSMRAQHKGDCELVGGDLPEAALAITPLSNGPSTPVYGVGLDVQINDKRKRLQIDTGASGLLLTRAAAISAGLLPEFALRATGIGDHGPASGFLTHVDNIRIGSMQFRNCLVHVVEGRNIFGEDGLIGTDVFQKYVVTLDTPARQLRLQPLPKRPSGTHETASLATEGESSPTHAPEDAYVAPEMKNWYQFYRIGHDIIVPTRIGKAPTKLFLMDTGASMALISPDAAREVTHVSGSSLFRIEGLGGKVDKVSEASDVTIEFAGVRQQLLGIASIDTSRISRGTGVEISGFIGFPTLRELVISIDYRDNLLRVLYDPAHGYHGR